MKFRHAFLRIYWLLAQFGINPKLMFLSVRGLPRYFRDVMKFKLAYHGKFEFRPCLTDWYAEGGSLGHEYFWQDLYVARLVYQSAPDIHVDVGSRIDGFVAHVASFREIEVFDIRPISHVVPGVRFKQADLMDASSAIENYCDSLSCLHTLEHFGLGRYGDPIDPAGFAVGLENMSRLVRSGGTFYLSVPVGISRVEFNAHRVFDPQEIIDVAHRNNLYLDKLSLFTAEKGLVELEEHPEIFRSVQCLDYGLGIFIFKKK